MAYTVKQQIVDLNAQKPEMTAQQIADTVGCHINYVRAVASREKLQLASSVPRHKHSLSPHHGNPVTCPECGSDNIAVVDSRPSAFLDEVVMRRRRKCHACQYTWQTRELRSETVSDIEDRLKRKILRAVLREFDVSVEDLLSAVAEVSDAQ